MINWDIFLRDLKLFTDKKKIPEFFLKITEMSINLNVVQ
jgi:hypothetical protein